MKNILNVLKFTCIFVLILMVFVACDKDFNSIQSDVLAGKDFEINTSFVPLTAYTKKLDSFKINNLGPSLFGVFNDPVYGQTKASIVAQVIPTSFNPSFGNNTVIDSVILSIPYYSKVAANSPDADGNTLYSISDSLYGDAPIKLSIYQNNYFLRDFDPNSETNSAQNYYSYANNPANNSDNFAVTENGPINFDDFKSTDTLYYNPSFVPSSDAIVVKKTTGDTETLERLVPALRVKLDSTFWKSAIIDKEGSTELSNANNFKDYFRGLYFKAEPVNNDGNMIMFNLGASGSNITIYYTYDSTNTDGEKLHGTYTLNFSGIKLNTFINDFTTPLEDGDSSQGDENLYLKGTGSMAVVDLFSGLVDYTDQNGVTSQIPALEAFKKTYRKLDDNDAYLPKVNGRYPLKRIINEAQLIVYEDETMPQPSEDYHKYDRLYAYDIKNNKPLADYEYDPTADVTNPFNSMYVHLGQRKTDDAGLSKYKIRITEQLNNILLKDSTNTKIGLVLSTNVNETSSAGILGGDNSVTGVPSTSIITPRGTVLYGSNANVPENKRMSLVVFFTDPTEN